MKNLQQLLGGYFHQDWALDAESWEEQLEKAVQDLRGDVVLRDALSELEELLGRGYDEQALASMFQRDLWCDFCPPGVGLTHSQWLIRVRDALAEAATASDPR